MKRAIVEGSRRKIAACGKRIGMKDLSASSEKNHGSRFVGILNIEFASKQLAKAQKPNSITRARPVI
jgi:hypothetical protein